MAEPGELLERILEVLRDPVRQAERILAEENRTDPWCWYCRTCGDRGERDDKEDRTVEALWHITAYHWNKPVPMKLGMAEAGHLLHVWCYPVTS